MLERFNKSGTRYFVNEDDEIIAKECTGCKKVRELCQYRDHVQGLAGKNSKCRLCLTEQQRASRGQSERKQLEESRLVRNSEGEIVSKKCSNCGVIKQIDDYSRNSECLGGRESRCKSCIYQYQKLHREQIMIIDQRGRARRVALPDTLTLDQWAETVNHFGGCALTGEGNIHCDHVIPLRTGRGGTVYGNVIPLRADLNHSKRNSDIFEWFEANRQRFKLPQNRFDDLVKWLADANRMTIEEYRTYVEYCHTQ
jgi:hypothetical protein